MQLRHVQVSTCPENKCTPKMRLAMPVGLKGSRASKPSPVPVNLIGFPLTAFTLRAAPPRESPSVLVRMAPIQAMES